MSLMDLNTDIIKSNKGPFRINIEGEYYITLAHGAAKDGPNGSHQSDKSK